MFIFLFTNLINICHIDNAILYSIAALFRNHLSFSATSLVSMAKFILYLRLNLIRIIYFMNKFTELSRVIHIWAQLFTNKLHA